MTPGPHLNGTADPSVNRSRRAPAPSARLAPALLGDLLRWHREVMAPPIPCRTSGRPLQSCDVAAIKELLIERRMTQRAIAQLFGVTPGMISHIKSGRRWPEVAPSRGDAAHMPHPQYRGPGLTRQEIDVVRAEIADGHLTQTQIARKHGITQSAVSQIKTGRLFSDR